MARQEVSLSWSTSASLATSRVIETTRSVLAPHIGETMARAVIHTQMQALGIGSETLDADVASELVRRIGRGLTVFVGSAETLRLLAEIAASLRLRL